VDPVLLVDVFVVPVVVLPPVVVVPVLVPVVVPPVLVVEVGLYGLLVEVANIVKLALVLEVAITDRKIC